MEPNAPPAMHPVIHHRHFGTQEDPGLPSTPSLHGGSAAVIHLFLSARQTGVHIVDYELAQYIQASSPSYRT
jgi:hypothetical protein